MNFQRNDIITALEGDDYPETSEYAKMSINKVLEDGDLEVVIISHEVSDEYIGNEHTVKADRMVMISKENNTFSFGEIKEISTPAATAERASMRRRSR